ncbi:hypothetical protein CHS0354_017586 [Potamilus streckersoni]|uniref:Uncharacterized protein n=1 Tax=Potamilus streckersoni TaxID=2493646 RepID=A0AAE0RNU0_9BIVA|nr:hypothetical protein CHS0354_017586 [Potamilus streckersoni]
METKATGEEKEAETDSSREAFKIMDIEATLDDIKKAGTFKNAVKYLSSRTLDTYKPRPAEWHFGVRILFLLYKEDFRHRPIHSLVTAAIYLCNVHGYKSFPEQTRKDTRMAEASKELVIESLPSK